MYSEHVFVYGTLMRGFRNHGWLRGALFVKEAKTTKEYLLYDLGPFPGMVKAPRGKGNQINGELFKITPSILVGLDTLESVDSGLYVRTRVKLLNTQEPVWTYLYNRDVSTCRDVGDAWRK